MPASPTPETVFRSYRPEDLTAVQALIYRTIDACYTGVYPPEAVVFFKDYHSGDSIAEDARNGHACVLELEGRIIGVGCLVGTTIKRVFIAPEFQHRGLGRFIMARLEEQARKLGVETVDLDASLVSKRLYDFLGYQGDQLARHPVGSGKYLYYYPMTRTLR